MAPSTLSRTCLPAWTCTTLLVFLNHGLTMAMTTGNVNLDHYSLAAGALLIRYTLTFASDTDRQLGLEVFAEYCWTLNAPGDYGSVLMRRIVSNLPFLCRFFASGADVDAVWQLPNTGAQRHYGVPLYYVAGAVRRRRSACRVASPRL
jgi:hypothetical protein